MGRGLRVVIIACISALAAAWSTAALAEQASMNIAGPPAWKLVADKITAYRQDDVYLAEGKVTITRGEDVIQGEHVRYHDKTKVAEVRGNVVFTTSDFKVVCERMVVNLEHNLGKFYNGTAYFPANHYYISGDEIEKTGPDTFYLMRGRATSCDGPNPAWTFTGRNITVRREGYATFKHATFSTRYFPILYAPWLSVPVKRQRQSGLLMPAFSDSTRDGFSFTQPYFWAISDSKDMTIYLTHMGSRGLETTVEFRYDDWGGKGTYRLTYLHDQKPPTIDYPEPYGPTAKEDRYWLRGMSNLETKSGFNVKLDVDLVSDPRYLDEFQGGAVGYNNTRAELFEEFGRVPAEALDPLRKTVLQATRSVNNQNLSLSFEYTDDLRNPDNLGTIQRLPNISLSYPRRQIQSTPFFFSNDSQYVYFARKTSPDNAQNVEGHRLNLNPRLYWPMKLARFIDLEPSAGFRETIYYPQGIEEPDKLWRNYRLNTRELYEAGLAASTNMSRIYNLPIGDIEKIKHRIKPQVSYSFISERGQNDLPYWDSLDRIGEKQLITYGLVNYLVAKRRLDSGSPKAGRAKDQPGDKLPGEGRDKADNYEYLDLVRFEVFSSFDYVELRREPVKRRPDQLQDENRPFGPLNFELEINYRPYLWAKSTSMYDMYVNMVTFHDAEISVKDHRGDFVYLSYEMFQAPYLFPHSQRILNEYEDIHYLLNVAINKEWAVQHERRYSLVSEKEYETRYAVLYQPQCWGLRFEYLDRPDDTAFMVFISLLGMGEIGAYSYRSPKATPLED
ncbi:MAG: LPS assembly protein LptD [Pseudomonadota bacterium]